MTKLRYALLTNVTPVAFAQPPVMTQTPETIAAVKAAGAYKPIEADFMLRRSADSAAMLDYWDKTDTIIDGIGAMRLAGAKYLPKFADEDQQDYNYRLASTKMTNVYLDCVENLASKPFEEEVTLEEDDNKKAPSEIKDFIEDVDGSGNNLTVFAGITFFNGINSAIDWIFVDAPKPDPSVRSQADAKAAGIRPYWTHILGRNVLEPRSEMVNGIETLVYIRIFEPGKPDHIREFVRDETTGAVSWILYEKRDAWREEGTERTQFFEIDAGVVTIGVIPLVPFVTGRRDGRSYKVFPPMQAAADLQIDLYQEESALKYVKKLAGYPMLAGNGIRPEIDAAGNIKKLHVGPGRVLYGPSDKAGNVGNWTFVEPGAQTMKFLADDNENTIKQLRELGRVPLTATSGNLTVITTAFAAGKAKSAVGAWALMLKDTLENAMVLTCKFLGIKPGEYDPVLRVYTDFDEFAEGKDLDALGTARTNKDLSQETYWEELQRRRVLNEEFDPEVERQRLLMEVPVEGKEDTGDDDPSASEGKP